MATKVKGKLTHIFDPDQLQVLARQSGFVQRSTSQLAGPEFVELMSTEMIADATVSLDGLCDILRQLNPQAMMTPQALHQRILAPQAETYFLNVA